jgi:hypothetical protein
VAASAFRNSASPREGSLTPECRTGSRHVVGVRASSSGEHPIFGLRSTGQGPRTR